MITKTLTIPPVLWGAVDPLERGPLVCASGRGSDRNCIGNYGGQYVHYRAAAQAACRIDPNHIPDYTNTISPLTQLIKPNPNWFGANTIASFDPFGHLVANAFSDYMAQGFNVRPTIALTSAELHLPEIDAAIQKGYLHPDGKVLQENGRINVTKIAIEPVWHLPGMAKHYGVDEQSFREGLYDGLGDGPEALLNRRDLKVYLPSHGETTVYIIGDFQKVGDETVQHAARTHDKCGSSDTHGANICSCRPALMWGYEEGVRTAQAGGIGIIVYTEAEGRGHGVVPKNSVYTARQAGNDLPENYFEATERVAGIADLREQNVPTDVYRWMGIKKIDVWMSGSPHKTEAMIKAGIKIVAEKPIPPDRMEDDTALVEWVAKREFGGYHYQDRDQSTAHL